MNAENTQLYVESEIDFHVKARRTSSGPQRPPRRPPDSSRRPRGVPKIGICRRRNKHYF